MATNFESPMALSAYGAKQPAEPVARTLLVGGLRGPRAATGSR
jgi:hypothetical protein